MSYFAQNAAIKDYLRELLLTARLKGEYERQYDDHCDQSKVKHICPASIMSDELPFVVLYKESDVRRSAAE